MDTDDSYFHVGPVKEVCVNYEEYKLEEALQLFATVWTHQTD